MYVICVGELLFCLDELVSFQENKSILLFQIHCQIIFQPVLNMFHTSFTGLKYLNCLLHGFYSSFSLMQNWCNCDTCKFDFKASKIPFIKTSSKIFQIHVYSSYSLCPTNIATCLFSSKIK